ALRLEAVRSGRDIAWQVRKCRGGPLPATAFVPARDASSLQGPASAAPVESAVSMPAQAAGLRGLTPPDATPAAKVACLREAREAARTGAGQASSASAPVRETGPSGARVVHGTVRALPHIDMQPPPALQHELLLVPGPAPLARD